MPPEQLQKGEKVPGVLLLAEDMVYVHSTLIRAINGIYLQATTIPEADVKDFVGYCSAWYETVHEHHTVEEKWLFAFIEEFTGVPGLMKESVEQHHAFHEGLMAYKKFVDDVAEGKQKYDGQKFRDVIDAFVPTLRQHLDDEIDMLVSLKQYEEGKDWDKWFKDVMTEILKKTKDPTILVC
jgi:hemerythrin-like domain-containing protein